MSADKIIVDGCELTRVSDGDYQVTRGTVRFSLHQWRDEDGMPDGWEGRADGIAPAGYTYTIVVVGGSTAANCAEKLSQRIAGVRTALATPPLAPCEPSAEPSVQECQAEFIRGANEVCPEGYAPITTLMDLDRAGIAAVRSLCLRAREAPSVSLETCRTVFRQAETAAHRARKNPYECDNAGIDAIYALFVKEKLT